MKKPIFSIIKGIVKAIPVLGGLWNEIESNKKSPVGGKGKVDKTRLISYGIGSLLVLARIIFPEYINTELITNFF